MVSLAAILICSPTTYNLLSHNCNNFSDELAQFLCGKGIPKYILELPNEVLQTSLGNSLLLPLVQQLEQSARPIASEQGARTRAESPDLEALNTQIEEARSERAAGRRGED